jgi:hypothetical protein
MDQPVSIENVAAAASRKGPPDAVTAMAKALKSLNALPVGKDIADRLLTDERMERVWLVLCRQPIIPGIVEKLALQLRLSTYNFILDEPASPQDEAIAALFAFIVIEFGQQPAAGLPAELAAKLSRPHGSVADVKRIAKPYRDAAAICRSMISEEAPHPSPEQKRALEVAADYIDRWALWMSARAMNSPYFVGKRTGKLGTELRSQFSTLTAAVYAIYGIRMPYTVATMTNVAWRPSTPISNETADSWRQDLVPASWAVMG